jgi:hypothetical protein
LAPGADRSREYREWVSFAIVLGITAFELYLLPGYVLAPKPKGGDARAPFTEAHRRQAEAFGEEIGPVLVGALLVSHVVAYGVTRFVRWMHDVPPRPR